MALNEEALDKLMEGYEKPEHLLGGKRAVKQLQKRLLEWALGAELSHHLGYSKHSPAGRGSGNSRKSTTKKTLKTETGEVDLNVPRDRNGTFEPQIVLKHQTRVPGLNEKILALYANGMSVRDAQPHLEEIYQVEVSAALISAVTDEVWDEVKQGQNRPLERIYSIVCLDALMVKMRMESRVETRAVYIALGITMDGQKDVPGIWFAANEDQVLAASADRAARPRRIQLGARFVF